VQRLSLYPTAHFLFSAAAAAQFPPDLGAEVAICGRSNAGKSTAINVITARRALARTSKTPGRTRLVNFFELAPNERLIDLPGYGYAQGPRSERESWGELIEALAPRHSLRGLMLVVDARRGILAGDEQLLAWARDIDQPVHVLLSKADQLKRAEMDQMLRRTQQELGERSSAQLFSARSGLGLDAARGRLDAWLKSDKEKPRQSV
jgi:GTP-binding protein